jgi:hypothetical protein
LSLAKEQSRKAQYSVTFSGVEQRIFLFSILSFDNGFQFIEDLLILQTKTL